MTGEDNERITAVRMLTQRVLPYTVSMAVPSGFRDEIVRWCQEHIQTDATLRQIHNAPITEEYLRRRRWIGLMGKQADALQMTYFFETADDAFQFKMRWG